MKKDVSLSHEFALYYELLPDFLKSGSQLVVDEKDFVHRVERVLRLKVGEKLVLFNRARHATAQLIQMDRKRVSFEIVSVARNSIYAPRITFLLPILKRDALASAMYYLVESGVNEIQLLSTQGVQRSWAGSQEMERLERICIAAAEQSKNYSFPVLKEPISIAQAAATIAQGAHCFYGSPEGLSFRDIISNTVPEQLVLTCGPESDFTVREKEQLQAAGFTPLRLTPTILRAETAALCVSALFRTVFSR